MKLKTMIEDQHRLNNEVYEFAEKMQLSNNILSPIVDGVCDLQSYLNSKVKVMWVLKEPYDTFDDELGIKCPNGGGWSLLEDVFQSKERASKNKTLQYVIYPMYGLFNDLNYREMDYIRDCPDMAIALQQIAFINISKMPGLTVSKDKQIRSCYEIWKPILFKQIELYKPNVIIFGNTYKFFKKDLEAQGAYQIDNVTIKETNFINVFQLGETYLLDAYHPNVRKKKCYYVDSIIDTINKYLTCVR